MERKLIKLAASLFLLMIVSCNEPETVVTNKIYSDGSILRHIEMRNHENKFILADFQVPFDSTWTVSDTCEINEKSDTVWVRRAEKLFKSVEEINTFYRNDRGGNKFLSRDSHFRRRFRWFNTEYKFSENIGRVLSFGYPLENFMNDSELLFFHYPENIKILKKHSSDSLLYRELSDSVEIKTERWTIANLISGWIQVFSEMTKDDMVVSTAIDSLKQSEDALVSYLGSNEEILDSLWSDGTILRTFLGKDIYKNYIALADTALEHVIEQYMIDFREYSVKIDMPGKVTRTNGTIDSSGVLLWPVISDFFLTEDYVMWVESKLPNRWAWVITALFLLFVFSGLIIRIKKRG